MSTVSRRHNYLVEVLAAAYLPTLDYPYNQIRYNLLPLFTG